MVWKVCDVVRVNVRRAQARVKRPTEIVKVEVVQAGVLTGSLKAAERWPALSACSLRVKDQFIIGSVLSEVAENALRFRDERHGERPVVLNVSSG